MSKLAALACVLLLAVAATATPLTTFGRRPARQESNPDRDVEVVEPVNTGAGSSRGRLAPPESAEGAASDESSDELPFAFGIPVRRIGGFGGLSGIGLGARPILVRPLGVHPVLAARDDSDQASSEEDGGFIRPYLTDPMANFMAEMAEMMAAMRRQMAEVLSRGGGSSRDDVPDFTKLGNTTSTTKVIDGHVITVNETVVEGDGDAPDLHIRVIDVHPSEAPESAEGDKAAVPDRAGQDDAKDAESVESAASSDSEAVTPAADRSENEIPMKPLKRSVRAASRTSRTPARGDMASVSGDDYEDDVQQYQMPVFEPDTQQSQVPVFDVQQSQVPVFDVQQQQQQQQQSGRLRMLSGDNQVDVFDKPSGGRRADLSQDTLVNVLLERQHQRAGLIMVDPDAELMDVRDGKVVRVYGNPAAPASATANRQARRASQASW